MQSVNFSCQSSGLQKVGKCTAFIFWLGAHYAEIVFPLNFCITNAGMPFNWPPGMMAPAPGNEHSMPQSQAGMPPMDHSMYHFYMQQQQQQQQHHQPQQHGQAQQHPPQAQMQAQSQQSGMSHSQGQAQMPSGQPPWPSHPPMQPSQPYPSAMQAAPHPQQHHM